MCGRRLFKGAAGAGRGGVPYVGCHLHQQGCCSCHSSCLTHRCTICASWGADTKCQQGLLAHPACSMPSVSQSHHHKSMRSCYCQMFEQAVFGIDNRKPQQHILLFLSAWAYCICILIHTMTQSCAAVAFTDLVLSLLPVDAAVACDRWLAMCILPLGSLSSKATCMCMTWYPFQTRTLT